MDFGLPGPLRIYFEPPPMSVPAEENTCDVATLTLHALKSLKRPQNIKIHFRFVSPKYVGGIIYYILYIIYSGSKLVFDAMPFRAIFAVWTHVRITEASSRSGDMFASQKEFRSMSAIQKFARKPLRNHH